MSDFNTFKKSDNKKYFIKKFVTESDPYYVYSSNRWSFNPADTIADTIRKRIDEEFMYISTVAKYFRIKKVIFNNPATIIYWKDGTKTVVKCGKDDTYSEETGLALCFMKKALGNKGNYNNTFKKYIKENEDGKDNSN